MAPDGEQTGDDKQVTDAVEEKGPAFAVALKQDQESIYSLTNLPILFRIPALFRKKKAKGMT